LGSEKGLFEEKKGHQDKLKARIFGKRLLTPRTRASLTGGETTTMDTEWWMLRRADVQLSLSREKRPEQERKDRRGRQGIRGGKRASSWGGDLKKGSHYPWGKKRMEREKYHVELVSQISGGVKRALGKKSKGQGLKSRETGSENWTIRANDGGRVMPES